MKATILLNKALVRAMCALVSTDETRVVINGLYFEVIGSRLVCVATNGRMLSVVDVSHPQNILPAEGLSVIVPKPRLLPEQLEEVENEFGDDFITGAESEVHMILTISDGRAFWRDFDGLEITAPLIEGKFPDWRQPLIIARDAVGEVAIPAALNPIYLAHAMAVIDAYNQCHGSNGGVRMLPARGDVNNNGCAHIFRPGNAAIENGAVVLLMPMKENQPQRRSEDLIPSWILEKKGGES